MNQLIRRQEVQAATGKACSTIYRDIKSGLFPKPVKLSTRATAWPAEEISALNKALISGKTDEEIRELVASLHAARQA